MNDESVKKNDIDNIDKYNIKMDPTRSGPDGARILPAPARNLYAEPTGIEKTATSLTYDDLMQSYITSSSEQIREFALQELKKRMDTLSKKEFYNQIVDYWNQRRREYMQSVAQSKGNVDKRRILMFEEVRKYAAKELGLPENTTWEEIEQARLNRNDLRINYVKEQANQVDSKMIKAEMISELGLPEDATWVQINQAYSEATMAELKNRNRGIYI